LRDKGVFLINRLETLHSSLVTEHFFRQEGARLVATLTAHLGTHRLQLAEDAGNLLRLHEQNRAVWDQAMIQCGIHCLGRAAQGSAISEYHLEAGIAACHSTARDDAGTNWPRILALYDQRRALTPSPITAMNRAVAVARVHGPQTGMDALAAITNRSSLESSHLFHAIRGTFAEELGRLTEALTHFRMAANLAVLPTERAFIARRLRECEARMEK